ncbi:Basic-leucine zipper (bZIP) transcription factor family [Zostera marina]|uniref:Basic-leucine zipper (BZIP) transcription factor family n=1 Tax=Zostera marina TaxID=29655 RepID=A0A0K9P6Y4_ZOSMR|nr:Basic-leucine zipper (bZIP) transcription factor family [Zostera marina]
MEDGDLDLGDFNQDVDEMLSSCSMGGFFNDVSRDTQACTHTHTCNPPGPDLANTHTHTCFHVHTNILPTPDSAGVRDVKKRSVGNREAVRKYREKKKARTASLEDENRDLREENRVLSKKVQYLASLEAENTRLKCMLLDFKGRIDGEIGSFPYQRQQQIKGSSGNSNPLTLLNNANFNGNSCIMSCGNAQGLFPNVCELGTATPCLRPSTSSMENNGAACKSIQTSTKET